MQLIELNPKGIIVFVGDTHGDFEVSKHIINKYLKPNIRICFLGDYVDRGINSKENIDFLLEQKQMHPKKVYLLQGNHEGKMIYDFSPSRFWDGLNYEDKKKHWEIFGKFPLALSIGNIIATHGALPNIKKLSDFNKIKNGDSNWYATVWMDFLRNEGELSIHQREAVLQNYFDDIMSKISKKVLIRGHDSYAPDSMYDGRCITLFTSLAYPRKRTIAIADFTKNKNINSIDDLIIETV